MSDIEPIVIETGYVEDATREAVACASRRNSHWALRLYTLADFGLIGVGLATIALLIANQGAPTLKIALVAGVVGAWILLGKFVNIVQLRSIKSLTEQMSGAQFTYRFSQDGFSERSARSEFKYSWAAVKAIERGKHGMFVDCGILMHCLARDPDTPDDPVRQRAEEAVMALWERHAPNTIDGTRTHG